ncbi:MAG: diguanylate cyclase domain-containing protein [Actinomycetota bacterium]
MATNTRRAQKVGPAGEASQAASLERSLREKSALVELFQAVTRAANEGSTAEEAMQICLEVVCGYTGWPLGHVYIVTDDGDALLSTDLWHVDEDDVSLAFKRPTGALALRAGVGLPGRVLATGKPAWITDLRTDPNFPRAHLAEELNLASGMAFPAVAGGRVVAVLEFFARVPVEPDDALVNAMTYIGSQFGRVVERKRAEEALRNSEALKAAILESALDCIITSDHHGRIVDFNPAAERTFGCARDEVVGKELAETIVPPALRERHRKGIAHYLTTGEGPVLNRRIEVTALRADRTEFPIELAIHAIHLQGLPVFTAYLRDITARKQLEARLEHKAYHDGLTDLANRTLFLDRVEHALARSDRRKERHSVIYFDLDNFKEVNDDLGHAAGDELLVQVAGRLQGRLRPGDTVARLGGDEFAVLLEDTDDTGAEIVARRVMDGLQAPLEVENRTITVHASAGIACGASGITPADELLRRADEAMYVAKSDGKRCYAISDGCSSEG